ncbi:MAG: hypothetical protein JJU37_05705 [Balneolaceae bacterium]|nr:hypothetical protein [Balneolaceae bacterium]
MKFDISNQLVEFLRPDKAELDINKPYLFLHEHEVQKSGKVEAVNTIFLTNKECPFKCVMCDLWRHTTDEPTPEGAIVHQIEYALDRLPDASVIKLYNSGNFFDGKAIPVSDYRAISGLISQYDHVIVENHPKLTGPYIREFKDQLNGTFEIAMGLETIHPDVLPKLNKQITTDLFKKSTGYLNDIGVDVRAFILLNPPFLTDESENIEWCLRSVEFAFEAGVTACSIIPTRAGNGIMDKLQENGDFVPPRLEALEAVFEQALKLKKGRVFCDVWDLEKFSDCDKCIDQRKDRIDKMNLIQNIIPNIECSCRT